MSQPTNLKEIKFKSKLELTENCRETAISENAI